MTSKNKKVHFGLEPFCHEPEGQSLMETGCQLLTASPIKEERLAGFAPLCGEVAAVVRDISKASC
jgi:hypothetical protein